jgi:hypothetical protein
LAKQALPLLNISLTWSSLLGIFGKASFATTQYQLDVVELARLFWKSKQPQ